MPYGIRVYGEKSNNMKKLISINKFAELLDLNTITTLIKYIDRNIYIINPYNEYGLHAYIDDTYNFYKYILSLNFLNFIYINYFYFYF